MACVNTCDDVDDDDHEEVVDSGRHFPRKEENPTFLYIDILSVVFLGIC